MHTGNEARLGAFALEHKTRTTWKMRNLPEEVLTTCINDPCFGSGASTTIMTDEDVRKNVDVDFTLEFRLAMQAVDLGEEDDVP